MRKNARVLYGTTPIFGKPLLGEYGPIFTGNLAWIGPRT